MRIYLIRHGESTDDLEDAYGGAADFPLTDRGREQAREVAAALHGAPIQVIFSSPLRRASESAQIIASTLDGNLEPIVIDDLRERNSYGVLSGVTKERARELFGYVLDALHEKPGYSREPLLGAEDFDTFIARVRQGFEQAVTQAKRSNAEHIAIVTHGKFTQGLFEEVLHITKNVYLDLSAVNVLDYTPSSTVIVDDAIARPAE